MIKGFIQDIDMLVYYPIIRLGLRRMDVQSEIEVWKQMLRSWRGL